MAPLHFTTLGDGPPLVFVHGLAGSTNWWRRNTRTLSKSFKVYLIDLPGFGRSKLPCTLDEVIASLPAWLDRMGLERVFLVGHSMGGYVSLHLAATRPERVARLALLDSVGVPINAPLHQMARRMLAGIRYSSPTFFPTIVHDGLRTGLPRLLRLAQEILTVDARTMMSKVEAPTLVLWGTNDTVLPPALGVEMASRIPRATLEWIPRAGHNAMADHPALVNRHLVRFFHQGLALPAEVSPSVEGVCTSDEV